MLLPVIHRFLHGDFFELSRKSAIGRNLIFFFQNHGNLMKPTDISLRLWRNPYVHSERLRIADRLKAKHERDTMTATKRKDIQER